MSRWRFDQCDKTVDEGNSACSIDDPGLSRRR